MIGGVWLLMLAVNAPVLTKYAVTVDTGTGTPGCGVDSELAAKQLYASFFAFAYLIPLCIIGICSVSILRHITRHGIVSDICTEKGR